MSHPIIYVTKEKGYLMTEVLIELVCPSIRDLARTSMVQCSSYMAL